MFKLMILCYGAKDQPKQTIKFENQSFETSTEFSVSSETNSNPIRLDELPAACLLHVISFLDVQDTVNLAKTNRLMKSIAQRSYIRFSHVSFGDCSSIEVSKVPSILEEIGPDLKSVEISGLNVRILDCLSECCPNVTELKLVDPSNIFNSISFAKYLPFLKNITSLEIRKSGIYYGKMNRAKRFQNFDALFETLAKVEALNSLKIDYIETGDRTFHYLKSIRNLKCLHLNRYLATAPVLPIIPNFLHLKEIVLSIEDSKTNEIISELTVTD